MSHDTTHDMRIQLAAEPETAKIAEMLEIEIDEYIDLVIEQTKNPETPPEVQVVSLEQEEAWGVPAEEDVEAFFDQMANSDLEDDFAGAEVDTSKSRRAKVGMEVVRRAPKRADLQGKVVVKSDSSGLALKEQLLEQRRREAFRADVRRTGRRR